MKGTYKQIQYAEAIIEALSAKAEAILSEDDAPKGTAKAIAQYHGKDQARRWNAEFTVIAAIEAGDLDKAETLFASVERADLIASLMDGTEVNAGRLIDTYQKSFYSIKK
jgi:hypothetical protein